MECGGKEPGSFAEESSKTKSKTGAISKHLKKKGIEPKPELVEKIAETLEKETELGVGKPKEKTSKILKSLNYAELNPKWREIQKKYEPKGRGPSFVSAKPGTKLEKKLARFKEYEEFEGITEARDLLGPAIVEDRGLELVKRKGKNALTEEEIDRIKTALSDNYNDIDAFKSNLKDLDIPDSRLNLIYDSEKHVADGESEVAYARTKGARTKRWNVVYEGNLCEKCAEMDGEEVGIDEPFSNGEMSAHLHPNCRCSLSFDYGE